MFSNYGHRDQAHLQPREPKKGNSILIGGIGSPNFVFPPAHGRRVELIGRIQERYGVAKDEAEKQVDSWVRNM